MNAAAVSGMGKFYRVGALAHLGAASGLVLALATRAAAQPPLPFEDRPPLGAEITVGALATLAVEALSAQPWRHEPDPGSIEARALAINTRLARQRLDFESRLDGHAAVALTMDWHRRLAAGEDALALCREQIAGYERLP